MYLKWISSVYVYEKSMNPIHKVEIGMSEYSRPFFEGEGGGG